MSLDPNPAKFAYEDTLCYVIDSDEILLIQKKRGPGTEYSETFYNGPGGGLESGEDPVDGAIRETIEETGYKPIDPVKVGEVSYFEDGSPERFIHVFRADNHEHVEEVVETGETVPEWVNLDDIPYDNMWPSDVWWMDTMLEGKEFEADIHYSDGRFLEDRSCLEILSE